MNTSPPPESSSRSAAAPTRTTPGTIVIGSTCWAVMTPMIADPQTPRPSCVYYCTLRTLAPAIQHTKVHVKALDARLGALPCQESWAPSTEGTQSASSRLHAVRAAGGSPARGSPNSCSPEERGAHPHPGHRRDVERLLRPGAEAVSRLPDHGAARTGVERAEATGARHGALRGSGCGRTGRPLVRGR